MELFLPAEYKVLAQYADILPADAPSAAYPFTSFVINFNVATTLHRDWKDMIFCVVMALSDDECTSGGDLCFVEPGIRLQLRNGDVVMFLSPKLTHFNMHFKGLRASVVMHSDHAGKNWVTNRNNWEKSIYMNKVTPGQGSG